MAKMTLALAKKLKAELKRRTQFQNKNLLEDSFPQQIAFLRDPCRFKVLHCPRRAAKSYSIGLGLYEKAMETPGVKCFYGSLTIGSSRNIMWNDVLKEINAKFKLGAEFNESRLEVTLPNKSMIKLLGMDSNVKQHKKVLGGKYKVFALDEAAFFSTDIKELIDKTILPAVAQNNGEVWLASTCSDITDGFFYELTHNDLLGSRYQKGMWSVHRWSWKDNPYTVNEVQGIVDLLISDNPLVVETSHFKQMYLNEWYPDESALVYGRYSDKLLVDIMPKFSSYLLGVDLGLKDEAAFTLGAWNDTDKTLYILSSEKESDLDFTAVAQRIHLYQDRYNIPYVVIDGANAQGIEEMEARHNLNLQKTDKPNKWDYIRLLNSDFVMQKVKFLKGPTQPLISELKALVKDPNKRRPEEHPRLPNHCCDSLLYMWRYAYSYLSEPLMPKKILSRLEQAAITEKEMREELERQFRDANEETFY